jgi:hypothetical protein
VGRRHEPHYLKKSYTNQFYPASASKPLAFFMPLLQVPSSKLLKIKPAAAILVLYRTYCTNLNNTDNENTHDHLFV